MFGEMRTGASTSTTGGLGGRRRAARAFVDNRKCRKPFVDRKCRKIRCRSVPIRREGRVEQDLEDHRLLRGGHRDGREEKHDSEQL